eukprot:scaffold1444_cov134-Isochrysis_galbana.AAC.6
MQWSRCLDHRTLSDCEEVPARCSDAATPGRCPGANGCNAISSSRLFLFVYGRLARSQSNFRQNARSQSNCARSQTNRLRFGFFFV